MRPLLRGLLPLLILGIAGCGNGTLADIWDSFPEEAFNPPDDGGGGGGGGGGGITLEEVAAIAGGQGVTGTVKNIVLAEVSSETFAFLAAGVDGCHIVDVTEPDLVNASSYVSTIRPLVLPTATLAGGRVDGVAVVDGTYLVCMAVAPGATNCISVFHLQTLIPLAKISSVTDLSPSFVPPATAADAIVVAGSTVGKGGAVSGAGGMFFVATGTALAQAGVSGTPPAAGWTVVNPSLGLGTTGFSTVTDVAVNQTTSIYVSGQRTDGKFGFAALANPAVPIPVEPAFVEVSGAIQSVADDSIAGPGNYPLDIAVDALSLYVTGNNEVFVYAITPISLTPALATTVTSTGSKTIAVSGSGGAFAIGAGNTVRAGTNLLGQARVTGSLAFPNTFTIRGVAIRSTDAGVFLLVCAGTGGLRVVQVPRTSP